MNNPESTPTPERSLWDPQATPGSIHLLDGGFGLKRFEWTGRSWSTPGTGFGTKPAAMIALGWEYVRPL